MKILLAPAETKIDGGDKQPYCKDNFYFKDIFTSRDTIVKEYEKLLKSSSIEELSSWFGLKNQKECEKYSHSILNKPTTKAILRYTGVAFDALEYRSLTKEAQQYCDSNIVLFSNLFGPILGSDLIPDYKFKQGAIIETIDVIKEYKENIKIVLDEYLGDEVIDLRAGFYDKFYKPTASTITYKFLKDGKVVSHWAKYYRGMVVKELAKNNIQNFSELMNLQIDGLKLLEIQEKKNIKTLIMEIKIK
ncbi:MAG: YaaA family protein [Campylobacterota bacterium]|nr:YaaA family protein [Campylobacterota bacterium]